VIFSAKSESPVRVFIARSRDLDLNCGQILKDALAQFGLRGGGSSDLAQGDVPEQQEEELRNALMDAMRSASAAPRTNAP
jgi:alanyl-tRNA synthetase